MKWRDKTSLKRLRFGVKCSIFHMDEHNKVTYKLQPISTQDGSQPSPYLTT